MPNADIGAEGEAKKRQRNALAVGGSSTAYDVSIAGTHRS